MNQWWAKQKGALSDKKNLSITIFLGISLTFVGWISMSKFVEMYDSQASAKTIMNMKREISQLQTQYRDAHPETLGTTLKHAEERLIQDFTHLAHWAQDLQERGNRLALRMNYRILKTQQAPSAIQGITIVPLELQIHSQGDRSGYGAFLKFLEFLEQSGPHIEIQEAIVRGDGKRATHFTIGLSTWMKTHNSVEL